MVLDARGTLWGRSLTCLAPPGAASLPVQAVRPDALPALLETLAQGVAAFVRAAGFAGQAGRVCLLPGPDGVSGALLGLGMETGPDPFGALPFALPEDTVWRFEGPLDSPEDAVLGFCLGAYRFDQLASSKARGPARIVVPEGLEGACRQAETVWLARDLINLPANLLGPGDLAGVARSVLQELGAEVSVVEGGALEEGYPLVAAVGRGAERPPAVVVARWSGPGLNLPLISLCGKGVCFDSGGLDIKSSGPMLRMKKDMAGAAVALGLARLVSAAQLPVRLEVRLGCVENSISARAMRPLDIVRSRRGLSVSIGNTDAEGRLVLADLLADASDQSPSLLIDFATLTGAARVALGPDLPAFFCNDDHLAAQCETIARAAHDPVWRMPLWNPYASWLEGTGSDIHNVSDKPHAGAILAALFLERFVAPATRWAHFDIYGWNDSARPGHPEGGEAQGLRANFSLISRIFHNGK